MNDLRYPLGRFAHDGPISDDQLTAWIGALDALPTQMRQAVDGLSDAQFDTPYRPDGWTVRQVVHHVPDSHLNAFVRFKWTLTEETPTIKAYDEARWAELPDTQAVPVATALDFLTALHARWVGLLRAMDRANFERALIHPEHPDAPPMQLGWMTGMYAWHGQHHVAHITRLREREGW